MSRIRSRRRVTGIRRASALTAAFALVTATLTGTPAYAVPDDAQVTRWQRFRHTFGLREDRGFAEWAGLRASAGAQDVSIAYGTPLTVAEAALIDARAAQARAQGEAVRTYFRGQPTELDGGMYFDHRRNGAMVVLVTGDVVRVRHDLAARVPHADKVEVVAVRHSKAALRRIQDLVAKGGYRERGIEVVSTTLRPKENRVEIRVRSDVASATAALTRDIPGEAIRVERGDYAVEQGTVEKNSPPFRGGHAIGSGSAYGCSIGFIGHDGASQYYAITGGHCGQVGSAWYQPCCAGVNPGVGVMDYNPFRDGTSITDAARIPIISSRKSNQITRTMPGGGIYYYAITSWQGLSQDEVGDVDCQAGATSNWDCGQITATSHDYWSKTGQRWFYYTRKSDVTSHDGDSGGPHFHVPVAHGIHVARAYNYIEDPSDDEAIYSHIYDVLDDLYLYLYTG